MFIKQKKIPNLKEISLKYPFDEKRSIRKNIKESIEQKMDMKIEHDLDTGNITMKKIVMFLVNVIL